MPGFACGAIVQADGARPVGYATSSSLNGVQSMAAASALVAAISPTATQASAPSCETCPAQYTRRIVHESARGGNRIAVWSYVSFTFDRRKDHAPSTLSV